MALEAQQILDQSSRGRREMILAQEVEDMILAQEVEDMIRNLRPLMTLKTKEEERGLTIDECFEKMQLELLMVEDIVNRLSKDENHTLKQALFNVRKRDSEFLVLARKEFDQAKRKVEGEDLLFFEAGMNAFEECQIDMMAKLDAIISDVQVSQQACQTDLLEFNAKKNAWAEEYGRLRGAIHYHLGKSEPHIARKRPKDVIEEKFHRAHQDLMKFHERAGHCLQRGLIKPSSSDLTEAQADFSYAMLFMEQLEDLLKPFYEYISTNVPNQAVQENALSKWGHFEVMQDNVGEYSRDLIDLVTRFAGDSLESGEIEGAPRLLEDLKSNIDVWYQSLTDAYAYMKPYWDAK